MVAAVQEGQSEEREQQWGSARRLRAGGLDERCRLIEARRPIPAAAPVPVPRR